MVVNYINSKLAKICASYCTAGGPRPWNQGILEQFDWHSEEN